MPVFENPGPNNPDTNLRNEGLSEADFEAIVELERRPQVDIDDLIQNTPRLYDRFSNMDGDVSAVMRSENMLLGSQLLSQDPGATQSQIENYIRDNLDRQTSAHLDRVDRYQDYLEENRPSSNDINRLGLDEIARDQGMDVSSIDESWLNFVDEAKEGLNDSHDLANELTSLSLMIEMYSSEAGGSEFLTQPMPSGLLSMSASECRQTLQDLNLQARRLAEERAEIQRQLEQEQARGPIGNAEQFTEQDLSKAEYLEQNLLTSEHPEAELSEEDALLLAQTTSNPDILAIVRLVPGNTDITRAVVTNPAVTREILVSIANSPILEERAELALNTDDKEVLLILCSDLDDIKLLIASFRTTHPDYPELAEELFWSTLGTDNMNQEPETNIIANLLFPGRSYGQVGEFVIDHIDEIPEPILLILANNASTEELDRLARNTNNWDVQQAVFWNVNTSPETKDYIVGGQRSSL
jgi:hypothetical protein